MHEMMHQVFILRKEILFSGCIVVGAEHRCELRIVGKDFTNQ